MKGIQWSRARSRGWGMLVIASAVACSATTRPDGPIISVSLFIQQSSAPTLLLRVDVDGARAELQSSAQGSRQSSASLTAPRYGAVPVRVALTDAVGDTLASVAFTPTFQRDYSYGMLATVTRTRPMSPCVGSLVLSPIKGQPGDTLFVQYDGIPIGAVC